MTGGALRRVVPIARLLAVAQVALMAGRQLARLDAHERRRLLALVRKARGRPRALSAAERLELARIVAKLEPRLFLGLAVKRLSPLPLPKRLLFGKRGSAARRALTKGG